MAVNSALVSDLISTGGPVTAKQTGEHHQHIITLELGPDMDRNVFSAVLADHGEHPERFAIVGAVGN